jgi:hypothetical protein
MGAAPVGVDREPERHPRGGGDLVDDAAGVDVEELHAPVLALADVPLDDVVEQGDLPVAVAVAARLVGEAPTQVGGRGHTSRLAERSFVAGDA